MNIQLVADGSIYFRASIGDPVGILLEKLLTEHGSQSGLSDQFVPRDRLAVLRDNVHRELRRMASETTPVSGPSLLTRQVTILDAQFDLYPRNPDHAELLRLAELARTLDGAVAADRKLTVYVVPKLDVAQFILLSGTKAADRALTAGEVRDAAKRELVRLGNLDGVSDDAKALYNVAAAQIGNDSYFAKSVDFFLKHGFLSRNGDGLLSPTTKLRLVAL